MRELYFDVWAGDDLKGTAIGELTDAGDKRVTIVDNGMGAGEFRISRHSPQYDWVTPGPTTPEPLIRCRREAGGPFDYDDARYFGAFFVEEGNDVLVSPDEEGGEDATRSGRGIESILARAIVDFEAHYSDDIVNHPYDKTALTDGQWHMDEDIPGSFSNAGTPGAVLRIFLRNAGAQTPEPIPEVTHDFSINYDSNGDPWPDGDAKWSFDVGTSLLDVLGILVNGGLFYKMTPDFVLHAWGTAQGTDLSGSITVAQAVDLATSGERAIHASPAKSRLLVKGQTEGGVHTFRWVADTGIESVLGVRQGALDYQASPTDAILDKAGNKELADRKAQHDGPPTMGVLESSGEEAFIDYGPGDTLTVDIPGVYDTEPTRIFSITLIETDTGEADPTLEFAGEAWSGLSSPSVGTHSALNCPFFRDLGAGAMRMRVGPDGTPYDAIYATEGVSGEDSFISVLPDQINLNAETSGGYASIGVEGGGDIDFTARNGMNFVIDGPLGNDTYFLYDGGTGIRFPKQESDPTGPQSHEGMVYYNTTDDVLRWYDGSVWADVGSGGGGGGSSLFEAGAGAGDVRFVAGKYNLFDSDDEAWLFLDGGAELAASSSNNLSLMADNGDPDPTGAAWISMSGGAGVDIPHLSSAPASPFEGLSYYDDTDHTIYTWNGSSWIDLGSTGGLSGSAQTYTESNVTTDRSYNANATTVDELADVLGTLIADLRNRGVVN